MSQMISQPEADQETFVRELLARNERRRPIHDRIARIIVHTGRADGITARQIARYNPREIFAKNTRIWLWSMYCAGYGNFLRIPSGSAGGRPTTIFLLDPALADRIAAELKSSANPTKQAGGTIRGRCAKGSGFTANQRACLHHLAADTRRSLRHEQRVDHETILDLRNAADVALINRAAVNGWLVPPRVCEQIAQQMDEALEHHRADAASGRQVKQLLRIVNLLVRMEGRNMIEEGRAAQADFEHMRRRPYPEPARRPRHHRWTGGLAA